MLLPKMKSFNLRYIKIFMDVIVLNLKTQEILKPSDYSVLKSHQGMHKLINSTEANFSDAKL